MGNRLDYRRWGALRPLRFQVPTEIKNPAAYLARQEQRIASGERRWRKGKMEYKPELDDRIDSGIPKAEARLALAEVLRKLTAKFGLAIAQSVVANADRSRWRGPVPLNSALSSRDKKRLKVARKFLREQYPEGPF